MAYEKKVYLFEDFEKCDLEMIPSLDLPSLQIDELYMPRDGSQIMLFLTSVRRKKDEVIKCPYCNSTDTIRRVSGVFFFVWAATAPFPLMQAFPLGAAAQIKTGSTEMPPVVFTVFQPRPRKGAGSFCLVISR